MPKRKEQIPWTRLEEAVHCDVARRGVPAFRVEGQYLGAGHLRSAAASVAEHGVAVALVTGFCVQLADRVTAETDGPPGALYLARTLLSLGIEVALITDAFGSPLLEAGCDLCGLPRGLIHTFPFESPSAEDPARRLNGPPYDAASNAWVDAFLATPFGGRLTHLIAIERAGPSHSVASLHAQSRTLAAPLAAFLSEVPSEQQDICHNMRGASINAYTAKCHRLFEVVTQRRPAVTTIGIGDGGNEIGMGSFAWETLREAIAGGTAGRIACRIAADHSLVAGVCDWGAYALALAVTRLRGRSVSGQEVNAQRDLIETLVRDAGAVDGITKRREPTVDGLALDAYLQTLRQLQRLLE